MHLLGDLHLHHRLDVHLLTHVTTVLPLKLYFRFELLLKFSERLSIKTFVVFTISVIFIRKAFGLLFTQRGVLGQHLLLYHLLLLLVLHVLYELPLLSWIHVLHMSLH